MKIAPRLPPWNRCDDGFGSELGWSHIPSGVKELVLASEDDELLDMNKIFTEFYPRCSDILQSLTLTDDIDETYDWNLPLSIRAAYVIAGDLYLEGKMHQSALVVFFAALLHECMIFKSSLLLDILSDKNEYNYAELFAFIRRAVANTQTAKLLLDFINEMHPIRGWALKLKPMYSEQQPSLDQSLYVDNAVSVPPPPPLAKAAPTKLITLFLHTKADQYREFQIYEENPLQQLFIVCYLLSSEFAQLKFDQNELRYNIIAHGLNYKGPKSSGCHLVVSVNENDLYLTTSGRKTLKQLGINEGDICYFNYIKKESNVSNVVESKSTPAVNTLSNNKKKSSRRTKTSRRKPKCKDKATSAATSAANQEPTPQELKEAHSRSFEPVINQLRPRLQPIRRNLDSLTLERTRPKERRGLKVSSNDKENISNFSCTSESAVKAGKAVFPIVVGQETNLYKSFKPSHGRNSQPLKTISLDLHGMSKDEAEQALKKSLPTWIKLAMKGGDPWVIPVDIVCGGGNQILREVVAAWIKRENQVGNRPKNYHRV
jgi:DNA-nicking Smr family endonuclease